MEKDLLDLNMTETGHAFSRFMDTQHMMTVFQQELPKAFTHQWALVDCKIQHPRYKTYLNPASRDKSFLALAYYLTGINQLTQRIEQRILYAKVYLGARSHDAYIQACTNMGLEGQDWLLHLDTLGMVIWCFPFDPALTWLPQVLEPTLMRQYCECLFSQNNHTKAINHIKLELINYRPEIRCTFSYHLQFVDNSIQAIYGKMFAGLQGLEIQRRIDYLYQRAEHNPNSFVIAKPLEYDATLRILWLAECKGQSLLACLTIQNANNLMTQLAKRLADFHSIALDGLEPISTTEQLSEIEKKSAKLQQALPNLAERIQQLLLNLKSHRPQALQKNCLIHGDFHIQQLLLLDDQRIALFDFDELAVGNPLIDLTNFCADLYNLNLAKDFTEQLIHQLITQYKSLSATKLNDADIEWHLRIQLLTRAYRAYLQQKTNLPHVVQQLLTIAETGITYTESYHVQKKQTASSYSKTA